ncbi:MAG: HD domain-containing protein [Candidatus Kapaibacteriota bacterium]
MKTDKNESKSKKQSLLPQRIINIKFKPNYTGNYIEDKVRFLELFKKKGSKEDMPIVEKAIELMYKLFKDDRRGDGTMFYTHFLETAEILLTKFKIYDTDTIVAALLHDSLEDKKELITYDDIAREFNKNVAEIVDGVTKITYASELEKTFQIKIEHELEFDSQEVATIQKIFAYGLQNPRIFLVKFADRFHNILTLYGIRKPERRKEIANQTINIFVPLLKVFGFEEQAKELRDLCLFHTIADNPDTAEQIYEKLKIAHSKLQEKFLRIASEYNLEEILSKVVAEVSPNFLLTVSHKTLSDLWQELITPKNVIREDVPPFYQHYYWVINIPAGIEKIEEKINLIDNKLKQKFSPLGDETTLKLNRVIPNEIIQDIAIATRRFLLVGNDTFEVVYNLSPNRSNPIDIQNLVFQRGVYLNFDKNEYEAFLELIEYLYSQDVPNKMQLLIEYAKKIYPSSYITVKNRIDETNYIVPRGYTVLDLAFKINPNEAMYVIGARIFNEYEKTLSKGLGYVLADKDEFEFIISKKPNTDFDGLNPFSLFAINQIRKIKQNLFLTKTITHETFFKRIKIRGKDRIGLSSEISLINSNLHIPLTHLSLHLSPFSKTEFVGELVGKFDSFEKLNIHIIELLKIPEITEVVVSDI